MPTFWVHFRTVPCQIIVLVSIEIAFYGAARAVLAATYPIGTVARRNCEGRQWPYADGNVAAAAFVSAANARSIFTARGRDGDVFIDGNVAAAAIVAAADARSILAARGLDGAAFYGNSAAGAFFAAADARSTNATRGNDGAALDDDVATDVSVSAADASAAGAAGSRQRARALDG